MKKTSRPQASKQKWQFPGSILRSLALTGVTISALGFVGCSFNHNPTSSYPLTEKHSVPTDADVLNPGPNAKPKPPPTQQPPPPAPKPAEEPVYNQQLTPEIVALNQLFLIKGFDKEGLIVGKSELLTFKIEALQPDLEFEVKARSEALNVSTWKLTNTSTDAKQTYTVTVKPSEAVIGANQEAPKDIVLEISASSTNSETQALINKAKKVLNETFQIRLEAPPTLKILGFPDPLIEDESKTFQISVKGLSGSSGSRPKLNFSYDLKAFENLDFSENDPTRYISASDATYVQSAGEWRFNVTISPRKVPVDMKRDLTANPDSKVAHMRVSFHVETAGNGISSDNLTKTFMIERKESGEAQ